MLHPLKNILVIVLFATLANADDWVEMEIFAESNQEYLRKYINLENGIPSHDTLSRVMGMISPEIIQQLYAKWQEALDRNEGELLRQHRTMRTAGFGGSPCPIMRCCLKENNLY